MKIKIKELIELVKSIFPKHIEIEIIKNTEKNDIINLCVGKDLYHIRNDFVVFKIIEKIGGETASTTNFETWLLKELLEKSYIMKTTKQLLED